MARAPVTDNSRVSDATPVLILGGGMSGLGAAHAALDAGFEFQLLDAADRLGGVLETIEDGGGRYERAASATLFRDPAGWALFDQATRGEWIEPDPAFHARMVRRPDDRLVAIGPGAFFGGLFTPLDLLRLLGEPLRARGRAPDSLADFVRARLGENFYRNGLFPLTAGVYAGDPERISWRHAFPRMHARAGEGSLVLSLFKPAPGPRMDRKFVSGRGGMGALVKRLAEALPARSLHPSTRVESIRREGGEFVVSARAPAGVREFRAARVILAADAANAAELLTPLVPAAARLERIPHAPLAILHLRCPAAALRLPRALGFLNALGAGAGDLGCLFHSNMFPNRAPAGEFALSIYYGGVRQPAWVDPVKHDDAALVEAGLATLEKLKLLAPGARPTHSAVVRWARAIPQYEVDHPEVLAAAAEIERALPGLKIAGNYLRGNGAGDCFSGGVRAYREIAGKE